MYIWPLEWCGTRSFMGELSMDQKGCASPSHAYNQNSDYPWTNTKKCPSLASPFWSSLLLAGGSSPKGREKTCLKIGEWGEHSDLLPPSDLTQNGWLRQGIFLHLGQIGRFMTQEPFVYRDKNTNTLGLFEPKGDFEEVILIFPAIGIRASYYTS